MIKKERGDITKKIFLTLFAMGALGTCLVLPGLPMALALFMPTSKEERVSLLKRLYGLRRNGMLIFDKNEKGYRIGLTAKANKQAQRYNLQELRLPRKKKWDGIWRMVTFDIPETKRGMRLAVSRKLKELGFFAYQKSIFIYPYDCKKEIDFIRDYFRVRENVKYLLLKDFEGSVRISKHFKL